MNLTNFKEVFQKAQTVKENMHACIWAYRQKSNKWGIQNLSTSRKSDKRWQIPAELSESHPPLLCSTSKQNLWKYNKFIFQSSLVRGHSFSHSAEDFFNTSLKHLGPILNITISIRRCTANFESWCPEHTMAPLILIFLQSKRFRNEGSSNCL